MPTGFSFMLEIGHPLLGFFCLAKGLNGTSHVLFGPGSFVARPLPGGSLMREAGIPHVRAPECYQISSAGMQDRIDL